MEMTKKYIAAAGLPLLFAAITIFITHETINIFLLGGLLLIGVEAFLLKSSVKTQKKLKDKMKIILPFLLIVVGSIGVSASTTLTRESFELAKNPDHVTSCSISPIVACSPVIASEQAETFSGLPNPIFGIFGYTAMIIAGMSLLAGGAFASWWWRVLWLGSAAEIAFSAWLIYQSFYVIGAICLYCSSIWAISIPLFIYLTLYNFQNGHLPIKKNFLKWFEKNHLLVLSLVYALIILLAYFRFDYYWNSLI